MTTLNFEHVTPVSLVSRELGQPCGAVLPGTKPGAAATTPNGRLVSEGIIGRHAQSPPQPRAERRRSSPTHRPMRISRSPPALRLSQATGGRAPGTPPPSRVTARLHGRGKQRMVLPADAGLRPHFKPTVFPLTGAASARRS